MNLSKTVEKNVFSLIPLINTKKNLPLPSKILKYSNAKKSAFLKNDISSMKWYEYKYLSILGINSNSYKSFEN